MCSALTALSSAGFWVSVAAGGRWLPREALRRAGARQVPADGAPGGGGHMERERRWRHCHHGSSRA